MTIARCLIDPLTCKWEVDYPDKPAADAGLNTHVEVKHGRREQPPITQLDGVDWHYQALNGILDLACTGRPFVISDVIGLGVADAPNPRTDWPRITSEAVDLKWIEPTGKLGHSKRPSTKGSPVTEWIGTATARTAAGRRTA